MGPLSVLKVFSNQSYQNMTIIKVALLFKYSSTKKKNEKDSVNFWHRKMTLKVRIVLFSTFNSETTDRPKIVLWPFS